MAQVDWIKTKVDMFLDEKIRLIEALPQGDTLIVIWMKLLVQAGKTNDNGYIYLTQGTPYTTEMLSIILNKSQEVVEIALCTFDNFGMIKINEQGIFILNWAKHQNVNGLDKIREQNRVRKQKQRINTKDLGVVNKDCDVSRDSHTAVTQCHATEREEEKEIKEDKEKELKKEREKEKREKIELLSSEVEIKSFVEEQAGKIPELSVPQSLLVDYIDCLRCTRISKKLEIAVVEALCNKWTRYDSFVVTYAMQIHLEKHKEKREEYTLAIMDRTNEHEAKRKLIMLQNKFKGSEIYEKLKTDQCVSEDRWDQFVIR